MAKLLETTNSAGIPVVWYGKQYSIGGESLIQKPADIDQDWRCVVDTGADAIEVYCYDTQEEAESRAAKVTKSAGKQTYPRATVKNAQPSKG